LANWIGELLVFRQPPQRDRPPKKADLVKLRDLFKAIRMYEHAIECGKAAISMDRDDLTLMPALRDIETEWSLEKSKERQAQSATKPMASLQDIKDFKAQQVLDMQDRVGKTDAQSDMVIEQRRKEAAAAPEDNTKLSKLAETLQD